VTPGFLLLSMFDAFQLLGNRGRALWLLFLERLGLLLQDGQPHRNVEPVDHMFAVGM